MGFNCIDHIRGMLCWNSHRIVEIQNFLLGTIEDTVLNHYKVRFYFLAIYLASWYQCYTGRLLGSLRFNDYLSKLSNLFWVCIVAKKFSKKGFFRLYCKYTIFGRPWTCELPESASHSWKILCATHSSISRLFPWLRIFNDALDLSFKEIARPVYCTLDSEHK